MTAEQTLDNFHSRLKKARKDAGYTQQTVFDELNANGWSMKAKQTVGHWETGQAQPDLKTLMALCEMFSVSPDWLLFGKRPALTELLNVDAETAKTIEALDDKHLERLKKSVTVRVRELYEDQLDSLGKGVSETGTTRAIAFGR